MEVVYSRQFNKSYKKLPAKMKAQCAKRLEVFLSNPHEPQLHFHKLSGKLEGLWSFNISGDVRVVVDMSERDVVVLVAIGSHSELYS